MRSLAEAIGTRAGTGMVVHAGDDDAESGGVLAPGVKSLSVASLLDVLD